MENKKITEENWREKIRKDYKGIISKEQIQTTIDYLEDFIKKALAQKDEEFRDIIKKYIDNCDKALKQRDNSQFGSVSGEIQLTNCKRAFENLLNSLNSNPKEKDL